MLCVTEKFSNILYKCTIYFKTSHTNTIVHFKALNLRDIRGRFAWYAGVRADNQIVAT